jgi:FtsP/CotA-like multicopper oxidase with cupredoxin domain
MVRNLPLKEINEVVNVKRRTLFGLAGSAVAGATVLGTADVLNNNPANASTDLATELIAGTKVLTHGPTTPQVSELTPFKDPLRVPPTIRLRHDALTTVRMIAKNIRLHSQLPPTPMWTFEGHYPGPTFEVRSEQTARIAWTNLLRGTSPVKAVWAAPDGPPPGFSPYNVPGSAGTFSRPEIAALTSWTTVHLHGGHQFAISDGLADSAVTYGNAQLSEYPNDEAAAHLFYHDHAMPITAINVEAGLIGNYLVRDAQEDRLDLPRGKYEIPLTLADVNFDTDSKGLLDGHLLSKRVILGPLTPGVLPLAAHFLGPYTMVNGVVWPYLEVEARAYRFRMLNASVGRDFLLAVLDESTGKPVPGAITVVGTDLGLLGKPKVIDGALPMSSAERVDVVIDFAKFAGKRLRLVNTIPGVPAGVPVPPAAIPYPEVMQFRVAGHPHAPYTPPKTLAAGFRQLTPADVPKNVVERFVMIGFNAQGMAMLMELQEVASTVPPGPGIVQIALPGGTRTFRNMANVFEDVTTFFSASNSWQKWTFISVDPLSRPLTHPMHIHLLNFQLLSRNVVDNTTFDVTKFATTAPIAVKDAIPIGPAESGWKDTVALPVNTMVTVLGQLGSQTGRFMYHCHILDHEDGGMMRPHVIMPPSVLTIQNMTMAFNGMAPAAPMASMPGMGH